MSMIIDSVFTEFLVHLISNNLESFYKFLNVLYFYRQQQ